jgi:hypothetical protein
MAIRIADGIENHDALYTSPPRRHDRAMTSLTTANDVRSMAPVRHGAYLCFRRAPQLRGLGAAVRALSDRLELRNEFEPGADHPRDAIAFLRGLAATPAQIADDELMRSDAIVHVASPRADTVTALCDELAKLLGPDPAPRVLRGIVRPMTYTGHAMHNFAYGHRVLQQPGGRAPNAFLVPMSKTSAWWQKDWMERHTYFLPRYDERGRMERQGHALAAAPGIASLMRRTYKHPDEPAPAGSYDFVTYFECADDGVATFDAVCAALRDVAQNPEWAFVREGPTWRGRRVATWEAMFEDTSSPGA